MVLDRARTGPTCLPHSPLPWLSSGNGHGDPLLVSASGIVAGFEWCEDRSYAMYATNAFAGLRAENKALRDLLLEVHALAKGINHAASCNCFWDFPRDCTCGIRKLDNLLQSAVIPAESP